MEFLLRKGNPTPRRRTEAAYHGFTGLGQRGVWVGGRRFEAPFRPLAGGFRLLPPDVRERSHNHSPQPAFTRGTGLTALDPGLLHLFPRDRKRPLRVDGATCIFDHCRRESQLAPIERSPRDTEIRRKATDVNVVD